jgi:hypothetical protein
MTPIAEQKAALRAQALERRKSFDPLAGEALARQVRPLAAFGRCQARWICGR